MPCDLSGDVIVTDSISDLLSLGLTKNQRLFFFFFFYKILACHMVKVRCGIPLALAGYSLLVLVVVYNVQVKFSLATVSS